VGSGTRPSIESILVVEDDRDMRDMLIGLLEDAGFRVRAVNDGIEALAVLRSERIALMVFDLMMPGMGGIELRRRQLEDTALAGIPVVAITGDNSVPIENLLVLRKPFDPDQLIRAIRVELDSAEAIRHRELLAAVGDVRRQMEKAITDLESVRRTSSPGVPSSKRKR
jgi:CheY-like chemotaxis protein